MYFSHMIHISVTFFTLFISENDTPFKLKLFVICTIWSLAKYRLSCFIKCLARPYRSSGCALERFVSLSDTVNHKNGTLYLLAFDLTEISVFT